jgi:hypothetical protein
MTAAFDRRAKKNFSAGRNDQMMAVHMPYCDQFIMLRRRECRNDACVNQPEPQTFRYQFDPMMISAKLLYRSLTVPALCFRRPDLLRGEACTRSGPVRGSTSFMSKSGRGVLRRSSRLVRVYHCQERWCEEESPKRNRES